MTEPLLSIRDLVTEFDTPDGVVSAVNGVSYDVFPGETVGVVGESGSGKSVTVMTVLGLISQPPGRIAGGEILLEGRDLLRSSAKEMRKVRGDEIAMIFQDPMTSLNPVLTIGDQLSEALLVHNGMSDSEARKRVIELLELVGVPNAEQRYDQYPHEYSGGMRQRAMIALALACRPELLLADEPTTALDATVQIQILLLLRELQRELGLSIIFVTHDLGAAVEVADRIAVMYAGRIVEEGSARDIINTPRHPYTIGLLKSRAHGAMTKGRRLDAIAGSPPDLADLPEGCAFAARCPWAIEACRTTQPALIATETGTQARCLRTDQTLTRPGELVGA